MPKPRRLVLTLQLLITAAFVSVAIGFMAKLLWPHADTSTVVLYTLAGWGLLGLLTVGGLSYVITSAAISQWVLRHGGTDTQWLWFRTDPPGLAKQRPSKPD